MTNPAVWYDAVQGDIWLVGARGRLDHTLVPELEAALERLLAAGRVQLAIDLSQVDYVNSGCLRVLVGAWRNARRQGGDLCLCGLTRRVQDIVETMGLHRMFQLYAMPAEAVSSLAKSLGE